MSGRAFWQELKRRHVYRVAIVYAIVAWLLLQLVSIVFPTFNAPAWAMKVMTALLAIGFPVALMLAWAFDVTPRGIERADPQGDDATYPPSSRSRRSVLAVGVLGVLIAVVAVGGWWRFERSAVPPHAPVATANAATSAATVATTATPTVSASAIPAKSIAVLPFENLSTDKGNAYFADGMQDLILTKLADIGDLKVISRTSTEKYKSHPEDLRTIGQQLSVATILEGSVQKAGKQVLINVQLIDAKTDSHIWAQSYQRTLDDIFGVEGEVAEKIATALEARLSAAQTAQLAAVPTTSPVAYDLFLHAEYQANQSHINYATASMKAAIPLYRQAIKHDAGFALAYARLSFMESTLAWQGGAGEDVEQLDRQARADADQALKLAPHLAAAHLALGFCDYFGKADYPGALKAFGAALALKPNDPDALEARGYVERRMGHVDAAIASLKKAFALDPRNSSLASELGITYAMAGRDPDAERAFQRALAIDPHNRVAKGFYSGVILSSTGDVARALQAAQGDAPRTKLWRVKLLTYERKYRDALALLDSVPNTPDNFPVYNASKTLQRANLYRLMHAPAKSNPLFRQALATTRKQLAIQRGTGHAAVWQSLADAELGLGRTKEGLASIAKSLTIAKKSADRINGPSLLQTGAALYAQAGRADLAVPLLARVLADPGIRTYPLVMLWLDPAWDPIRHDPRFQALLKKYADAAPATAASGAGHD